MSVVLFLILGAVSYYFYARMSQLERKVGLMENILFDLKMTTEQAITYMTDAPTEKDSSLGLSSESKPLHAYAPTEDEEVLPTQNLESEVREFQVEQPSRTRGSPQTVTVEHERQESKSKPTVSSNYEAMTYKELVSIARSRNVSGLRTMSKAQVIDALRARDGGGKNTLSLDQPTDIQSWMQDATPLADRQPESSNQTAAMEEGGGTLLEAEEVDASFVGSE